MTTNKRKKDTRQRAKTSHGFGSMKKNRGAGHRGGRGRSGSGKRGDQKKPRYWKEEKRQGKHGFSSKSRTPEMKTINIKTLEDTMKTLVSKGLAQETGGTFAVNLSDLGYNKLLGTGKATLKMNITTDHASPSAVEKVNKAGGEVKVMIVKKKKEDSEASETEESGEDAEGQPAEE